MSAGSGASELDHRARKLQGAMLEHPGLTIERMPGLGYVLNQFIGQAPLSLSRLVARLSGRGSIEEVRSTTLFQAVGDCGGLTAAIYKSAPYDSRLLIALDERIDDLIVSSIFGEAVPANPESDPGSKARESRTAIETALLEEFSRALGNALEAAFASVVPLPLAFERLITLSDPFALGRRDGEAAAARFSLEMNGAPASASSCSLRRCFCRFARNSRMIRRRRRPPPMAAGPGSWKSASDRRGSRSWPSWRTFRWSSVKSPIFVSAGSSRCSATTSTRFDSNAPAAGCSLASSAKGTAVTVSKSRALWDRDKKIPRS